jgi:hypothetical protein
MAPKPPGIDTEKIKKDLDSVFKMMEKHFTHVDEVVNRIDVAVNNVKLPKDKFREIAHSLAKDKGSFEYKYEKKIEKARKFHYRVLGFFIGFIMSVLFSLLVITILKSFDESKTPTKEPTQIEKVIPNQPTNKTGPIFREIE